MKYAVVLMGITLSLLSAPSSFAQTPATGVAQTSNPEMKSIFDADQADRSGDITKVDWSVVSPRDEARRQATRRLLADGQLHTGADFLEAAFVFQHGSGDDFLLAHTLAVVATKKGDPGGAWIAAATLDRYLQSAGHKQIYGTQSSSSDKGWTKEPYDRDLISDALRRELNVPDLATQAAQLETLRAQSATGGTTTVLPAQHAPTNGQLTCNAGPITRIYVRATWQIHACDNGGLLVMGGGEPAAIIIVTVVADRVIVMAQPGGDAEEVKVATAAFQAMTPAQIADIVAQTRSSHP